MSAFDHFKNAWFARFPDPPPDLSCLRGDQMPTTGVGVATSPDGSVYGTVYSSVDVSAIERALQTCNANIEQLHRQIERQQFVANYLWEVLHRLNTSADGSVSDMTPSPGCVSPGPPLLKHAKKKSFSKPATSIRRTVSVPLDAMPDSSEDAADNGLDNPVPIESSSPVDTAADVADSGAKTHGIPTPVRKSSLPLLDQNTGTRNCGFDDEHTVNSDSKLAIPCDGATSKPGQHRQKPVPTPRFSVQIQKTAGQLGPCVQLQGVDVGESTDDQPAGTSAFIEQLSTEPKRRGGPGLGSVKDRAKVFDSAASVSSEVKEPVVIRKQVRPRDDHFVREETTHLPSPARPETVADDEDGAVSSDDEEVEPLYFNIILLKEQQRNRAQSWYGKVLKAPAKGPTPAESPPPVTSTSAQLLKVREAGKSRSSDSVRSADSDSAFDEKPSSDSHNLATTWKKRTSLFCATGNNSGSQSENDELDTSISLPTGPDSNMLQMRKWVVTSVLESERAYLNILDILMQYMQTFKNLLKSSQPLLAEADIETMFFGVANLHMAHKFFVNELEPVVANWSAEKEVAMIFRKLSTEENRIAAEYLKNYQKAVVTIRRCWQENERFAMLTKSIQVKGMEERPSLEELLHKPVVRFQRNTLLLHDLVKCTPTSHADYDLLQKTLSSATHFIEHFDGTSYKDSPESQRYLAKHGLIVEKVGNVRKLRYIFLFNDMLCCARQKISKQRITFEPKWQIALIDLTLDDKVDTDEEKQLADVQQQEIEQLQRKVSELQVELKHSKSVDSDAHRNWSFHNKSKSMEKIKKKLMEQQAAMIKASPRLLFRVINRRLNRSYTLLMASDYERTNWRFCITGLLGRAPAAPVISATDLQILLNSQKLPKASGLGSLVGTEDIGLEEELLYGSLHITIFKLQGLKQPADAYCTVEVDSFGHFFIKAKTKVSSNGLEPEWKEDFEIDLEGAQTVRILCYRMTHAVGTVIGTCALELSKAWLRGDFLEKAISLSDETSLVVSLRYANRDQTLKRSISTVKGGVFGVRIKAVAKREGSNIPLIIGTCIDEVEQRGMKEVGIYRISGVSGEIQKLKKAFEKNARAAAQLVKEADIHVVTGLLKLYFRELPEALFTDALYPELMTGMGLSDPEAKEKYFVSVLQKVPEPNHSTVNYVIDHLLRVSSNEADNKMSLQNLATVFGPTLLRPATKDSETQTMEELFSTGTRDAMAQTTMLLIMFNLRKKGLTF